jgi:hypothetical protein
MATAVQSLPVALGKRKCPVDTPSPEGANRRTKQQQLEREGEAVARLLAQFPNLDPGELTAVLERCNGDADEAARAIPSLSFPSETSPDQRTPQLARVQHSNEHPQHHEHDDAHEHLHEPERDTSEREHDIQPGAQQEASQPEAHSAQLERNTSEQRDLHMPRFASEQWSESLVHAIGSSRDECEAKGRAYRALCVFESEVANVSATGHEKMARENAILKRAVAVQHGRYKVEMQHREAEMEDLRKQLNRLHEDLRSAQVANYSLQMHLRQAMDGQSFPTASGNNGPDVF